MPRLGDGGTCSPDTLTFPKKNATRGRGIEPAPAAFSPLRPPPVSYDTIYYVII